MGNEERNAYTKNHITNALIDLLYHKNYSDINISEIVKKAQVSRNSFYRNYNTKEDILNEYLDSLLFQWKDAYDRSKKDSRSQYEIQP